MSKKFKIDINPNAIKRALLCANAARGMLTYTFTKSFLDRIIAETPYDTGTARRDWQYLVGDESPTSHPYQIYHEYRGSSPKIPEVNKERVMAADLVTIVNM